MNRRKDIPTIPGESKKDRYNRLCRANRLARNGGKRLARPNKSPLTKEFIVSNIIISKNGCWEWQKARNKEGYGMSKDLGKDVRVHRKAYELWNKPIPRHLYVCHRCDNPSCCNPEHLALGTNKQNQHDFVLKGLRKDRNLSEADVLSILSIQDTYCAIGKKFGVNPSVIRNIKLGKSYLTVTDPDPLI